MPSIWLSSWPAAPSPKTITTEIVYIKQSLSEYSIFIFHIASSQPLPQSMPIANLQSSQNPAPQIYPGPKSNFSNFPKFQPNLSNFTISIPPKTAPSKMPISATRLFLRRHDSCLGYAYAATIPHHPKRHAPQNTNQKLPVSINTKHQIPNPKNLGTRPFLPRLIGIYAARECLHPFSGCQYAVTDHQTWSLLPIDLEKHRQNSTFFKPSIPPHSSSILCNLPQQAVRNAKRRSDLHICKSKGPFACQP